MQRLVYNIRRVRSMYTAWYQPEVYMSEEDWIYCACLVISWIVSIGLGMLIGIIIC